MFPNNISNFLQFCYFSCCFFFCFCLSSRCNYSKALIVRLLWNSRIARFCLFRVSCCLYLLSAQKTEKNNISRGEKTTLTQHPSIYPSIHPSSRPVIHSSIQFSTSFVYSLSAITIIPPTTIVTTDSCGQLLLGVPRRDDDLSKHDSIICNDSELIDEPHSTTSARTSQVYNQKLWLLIIIIMLTIKKMIIYGEIF